jgi:UDP-N-acetylglucosamine--N-acetylmuramyl-(pentapeptide) pyrophosphoryl-undecaprenol N-acetylglucosamine transferase
VVYVGSEDGMEADLVTRESELPFRAIPAAALRGRAPWTLARNSSVLARGMWAARRLIASERPRAILGTGGYVCVPLFLAAWAAHVPTAIYLPDVVPGLAVRFLARLASVVACSVEDSAMYFRSQMTDGRLRSGRSAIVVTGYPARRELFEQDRAACRAAFALDGARPVLFVYGGSRGARSINTAIAALLEHILPIAQVIHICGREGDEHFLRDAAARLPARLRERYRLYPYLYSGEQGAEISSRGPGRDDHVAPRPLAAGPSMLQAFGAADLAVCRSGASTLGELPAAGLPAILVPYPYVNQEQNADYLVRNGAALKVADAALLGGGAPETGPLFQHIRSLLTNPGERETMAERSKALAQPDAAKRLADLLLTLATSKRPKR